MDFDLKVLEKQLTKRGFQAFVCLSSQEAINLITQSLIDENDNIVNPMYRHRKM